MAMVLFPCTGLTQTPTADWFGVAPVTQAPEGGLELAMTAVAGNQRHQVETSTDTRADAPV